ncbi:MAG TPA: signal peptidase I [Thermoanaerobaculia bacterium]|nr:signal peptidase I [Thermoanaerobaculia bacterium]
MAAGTIWKEWIRPFLVMLAVVGSLRSAVADWNDVPTGSMKPTILEGDRVVVNKLAYDLKVPFTTSHLAVWDNPSRGDIVVFFSPADGKRLVKRVIGIPGDQIEMIENRLLINGQAVTITPADPAWLAAMDPRERGIYQVASEGFGSQMHAMMVTPGAPSVRSFAPLTVPQESYFVMGDNRDDSYDSRFLGFIDRKKIVGRAFGVALSVNPREHYMPRLGRFFRPLL